jgi:molybdopterin molybdotransferase
MLKFEEALKKIFEIETFIDCEEIHIKNSFGRVVAEDVFTDRMFPDVQKSAVDGYAVCGGNLDRFKLVKTSGITDIPGSISVGEAVFVMTGGMVPEGAVAVLRVEDCMVENNFIFYNKKINPGENINQIGEESKKGELIVKKGTIVNERVFSALAYAGVKKLNVFCLPKVAFFTTGDEILNIDDEYRPGFIFNTNRYIFEKVAKKLGIEVIFYGNIKDDEKNISDVLDKLSENYRVIVTSGGISMGKYDFVKKILNGQGYDVIINRTSIKPGSPLMVAKNKKSVIFGLPGYPAAFLTNMFLYLIPFLKKSMGRKDFDHKFLKSKLKGSMHSRANSDYFNRAIVELSNGKLFVYDANSQKTSHFLNFANCNGLFRIPEGVGDVDEGFEGDLLLFDLELS